MTGAADCTEAADRAVASRLRLGAFEELVQLHQSDLCAIDLPPSERRIDIEVDGRPVDTAAFATWVTGNFGNQLRRVDSDRFHALLEAGAVIRLRHLEDLIDVDGGCDAHRIDAVARYRPNTPYALSGGAAVTIHQTHGRQRIEWNGGSVALETGESVSLPAGVAATTSGPSGPEPSLHIELTEAGPTLSEYLTWLRPQVIRLDSARRYLSRHPEERRCQLAEFGAELEALVVDNVDAFVAGWRRRHASSRSPSLPFGATKPAFADGGDASVVIAPANRHAALDQLRADILAREFPRLDRGDAELLSARLRSGPSRLSDLLEGAVDHDRARRTVAELLTLGPIVARRR